MGQGDLVSILEVMGRSAGWIAAGAALAKRRDHPHDPPHIILLPEVPFDNDKFLEDVRRVLKREKFCLVVVGEGLVDKDGNYVATAEGTDAFGHAQLGGAGDFLASLVDQGIPGVKSRTVRLGIAQRAAAVGASKADSDEAFMAGQAAVKAAVAGENDKCVILVRGDTEQYSCETALVPLSEIANGVKMLPKEWINEDGISMNFQFHRYALPLIQGEVQVPFENGLPAFVKLDKVTVEKLLQTYEI